MTKADFKRICKDLEIFMDGFDIKGNLSLYNKADKLFAIRICNIYLTEAIKFLEKEEIEKIHKDIHFLRTYS